MPNLTNMRPIGSEFWYEFPVTQVDTRGVQDRFLYRIVAYDNTIKGPAERLEVVKHETRPIIGLKPVTLSDRTIYDCIFGEWS